MQALVLRSCLPVFAICAALSAQSAKSDEVFYVTGMVGNAVENFKKIVAPWEKETGHTATLVPMPSSTSDQFAQYRLWLAAGTADIDLYQTDVVWAPQLADHFVDLSEPAKDLVPQHFPSIIASQSVGDKLVALPLYTDAPALYYRRDLLEKYKKPVPETWEELTATAAEIQAQERAAGNGSLWGFIFQGNAYEGLTCNALEWLASSGGGHIIEEDGSISVNNPDAVRALELARSWIGTITPQGVLGYQEEEARGVWQTGNAVFMRNWPYAYGLSASADSAVKDRFDVAPLPSGGKASAATLGGWNIAVSKYSQKQEAATSLALYLASAEAQKTRALLSGDLPTVVALYDDAEIGAKAPLIPRWKPVFEKAVPRPSAPTRGKYNEVSAKFWSAVHDTLSGNGSAAENLELLELELTDIRSATW